jgi:hypothetical protein
MIEFLKEFWHFIKARKKYWLIPIMLFLLMFGFLFVSVQGTPLAPFLYTIF